MKKIRLNESQFNRLVKNCVKKALNESFEEEFNSARDEKMSRGGLFGFELKNQQGDWEYGNITYNPNSQLLSCMGVSMEVDPSLSLDANLEGLLEELYNNGYTTD